MNKKAFKSLFVARKHMIKRKLNDNEDDTASSECSPAKKQKCKDSGNKSEDEKGLSDSHQLPSSPVKETQNEKCLQKLSDEVVESNDMEVDSSETEDSLSKNGVIVNQDSADKDEPSTSKTLPSTESENTEVHDDSSHSIKQKLKVERVEDTELKGSGGKFILTVIELSQF